MLNPPLGKPWLLYGLLGTSLTLNLVLVLDRPAAPAPSPVEVRAALPAAPAMAIQAVATAPAALTAKAPAADTLAATPPAPVKRAPIAVAKPASPYSAVSADVRLNLPTTFRDAVDGDNSDAVSAVFSRVVAWDLDLRRDLQRGDSLKAAYMQADDGTIDMPVAWYTSKKLGTTLKAYQFKAPGDTYASYWTEDGEEVPRQLKEQPIGEYVQITALVGDRTNHHGMDFKTPTGTPIYAPRAGTVTRVNWNLRSNGNCIELRFDDGTLAKYLHLSDEDVKPGQRVAKGAKLGLTGNTGRSTAPHLHYQLNKGSRVIDPRTYHGILRRQLPKEAMARFRTEVARLDGLLGEVVAQR